MRVMNPYVAIGSENTNDTVLRPVGACARLFVLHGLASLQVAAVTEKLLSQVFVIDWRPIYSGLNRECMDG